MVWSQELAMAEHLRSMENPDEFHDSEPRGNGIEVVTGVQISEMKQDEVPEVYINIQGDSVEITGGAAIENQEYIVENGTSVFEAQDAVFQDVILEYEPSLFDGMLAEGASLIPCNGITSNHNVVIESIESLNEDKGSSNKRRKGKEKPMGPVISSRSLRPKSQEKWNSPEPFELGKEGDVYREEKRGRKRKHTAKNNQNEFSRTKTHLRYLLHRIKYEQSLIDAYSAEGWKGQSLEKLKPEKELQHAKSHIQRYKLKIRALFERVDQSLASGKLPETLFDPKGEIDSEDIFCAKCGSKDLTLDNDIILCDGACIRGFHQFCLEPPLLKEDIPPGDEGWICPGCDCKQSCIDMLNDYLGTKLLLTDSWENVFPEAARAASGNNFEETASGFSDDSEDEDYDPAKPEISQKGRDGQLSPSESGYFSAPDDLVPCENEAQLQGLLSDDSEDDNFDPSVVHQEKSRNTPITSDSSDFTSDSEDLGALLQDEMDHENITQDLDQSNSTAGVLKRQSLAEELSHINETDLELVSGKRHVERLDYKKLHDEAFGAYSSESSDEDFEESSVGKKKRSNHGKPKGKSPSQITYVNARPDSADENVVQGSDLPKRNRRATPSKGSGSLSGSSGKGSRRSSTYRRLGEAVTQKLHSSFLENKYPEKSTKEKLAHDLGISLSQVSRWFENARWSFNHKGYVVPSVIQKPLDHISTVDATDNHSVGLQEAAMVATSTNYVPGVESSLKENDSEFIKKSGELDTAG